MGSTTNFAALANFVVDGNNANNIGGRNQLVRILSRSSTLPKIENIFIKTLTSSPKGFSIEPGEAIHIGTDILSKPIAALLCLRYGLEWQIWYENQSKNQFDSRLCDLAACRVAAKFHELTPKVDRDSIGYIPEAMAENIKKFIANEDVYAVYPTVDFEGLTKFHHQTPLETPLEKEHLNILSHLASPVEYLMMSGGDLRLNVDPNLLLNKYGCRPFPRPGAFTFASSTASSISNSAYNKAQIKRKNLIESSFRNGLYETVTQFSSALKAGLKKSLSIPEATSIILAPSGTDISLQVAGISQALFDKEVVHVLVAADETGSGVPLALEGCHFSDTTSQGRHVKKGELIDGFRKAAIKGIKLRKENGRLKHKEKVDKEVYKAVSEVFAQGKQPVLHAIDQSKLGYTAPSDECLQKMKEEFGEELLILVDNSQLRMDPEDIQKYLEQGYLMILTGSKFFTGPPFNGALLVPKQLKDRWEKAEHHLPQGLAAYVYKNEWPHWKMSENLQLGINLGVYMRWYASITEIERYYDTPLSLRYLGVELFCNHVNKAIDDAEFLEHLAGFDHSSAVEFDSHRMKDRKTIFPFFIKQKGKVLPKDKLDKLYRLLNKDLSKNVIFKAESDELKRLAGQACHIGQPVASIYKDGTASGVVRINLGSRIISKSWKDKDSSMFFKTIEEQMIQVDIIIRKIEMILNYNQLLED